MNLTFGVAMLIVASILSIASTSAAQNPQPASSSDKNAIEQLFVAWNSHDADRVIAAFSDDVVYEDVAAGQIHRGRTEVRKWVAGAFADIENFKLAVARTSIYKNGGVVEWVWSGTDKGLFRTGKSFSVRGVSVIEVRRGKVSSYKEYYDFATVMRQLGLVPAGDSPSN